jgi:hypothetical protein
MNTEFTIVWKGQSSGPFNQLEIQKKLLAGEITPLHVILRQGEPIDAIAWVSQLRSAVREEEAEARRQEEARTAENERLRFHQQENERLQRELKEAQQKAARPLPPPPLPSQSNSSPSPSQKADSANAQNQKQTTDIFAVLTFGSALLSLLILPIIFAPICYLCAIISYYRLKENPTLKGSGLRLVGAIIGAFSMLYMLWQFGMFR